MKTILELQDDLSHKVRCAADIKGKAEKENRSLTDAESKDITALLNEAEEIKKQIAALEADAALRDRIDASVNALNQPQPKTTSHDKPKDEPPSGISFPKGTYRFGALKAYKGANGEANAYKAGQWFRAAILGNHNAERWCVANGIDIRNAQSEGVNTAGGALVPDEMEQAIINLREEYGVFRQNARVLPMGRDTILIPRRTSGLTAYWTGEGVAATESSVGLDQVQLTAKKLSVLNYLSTELDEDAIISIVDMLTNEMALALAYAEDVAGFTGTGLNTQGGIRGLTARILDSGNTAGAVDCATAGHDTLAEVDNADLAGLMGKLPIYALRNAKFYCSQVAKALVFQRLKAVAGGNSVTTLEGRVQDTYLGYPIVVSQTLPTNPGNNEPFLFFGDLSLAATIGVRRGVTVRRDDSIKFVEDQIALKATERVDINIHDLGDTSTAGPIVGLIGYTS